MPDRTRPIGRGAIIGRMPRPALDGRPARELAHPIRSAPRPDGGAGEVFFEAYLDFTRMLFEMYGLVDRDAPLRAHITIPNGNRRSLAWWNESTMVGCFATSGIPDIDDIRAAYERLSDAFRNELYLTAT